MEFLRSMRIIYKLFICLLTRTNTKLLKPKLSKSLLLLLRGALNMCEDEAVVIAFAVIDVTKGSSAALCTMSTVIPGIAASLMLCNVPPTSYKLASHSTKKGQKLTKERFLFTSLGWVDHNCKSDKVFKRVGTKIRHKTRKPFENCQKWTFWSFSSEVWSFLETGGFASLLCGPKQPQPAVFDGGKRERLWPTILL